MYLVALILITLFVLWVARDYRNGGGAGHPASGRPAVPQDAGVGLRPAAGSQARLCPGAYVQGLHNHLATGVSGQAQANPLQSEGYLCRAILILARGREHQRAGEHTRARLPGYNAPLSESRALRYPPGRHDLGLSRHVSI